MIKVLYIITKSDVGGAQKNVSDLAGNLNKNNFEIKIIYGGKDIKWLSNKTYPWLLFFNDWLAIFELIKIYKKEQPNIIHLHSSKAGILGSLAAKLYNVTCCKIIFTAHGWVFNPTNAVIFPVRWFYIFLHKFAALFQNKIICVSEYDYQLALKYKIAPIEKLITIHNGINSDIKFLDKNEAREKILKKLSAISHKPKADAVWIGSIGRLTKEKNFETLIRAAALIPETYFFIIGQGLEYEKLENEMAKLNLKNRFFILKPTGNDALFLKAFDIFAMSSVKEGLPYILLEAMAAGLPIVVTEAGGMPEVVKNNVNGFLIKQKNPAELAEAIKKLLKDENLCGKFRKAVKTDVEEKFGLKKMISKTENVYKELLRLSTS